ncbi:spore coat associated protein CotJA [Metabacillus niabensis]|uniref:spore coat associated protein CotJA n=1 Tax=Metabacillus niabensis TaxID=324854 RepID=UPI001CFB39EB|nr:spore coat associated protein CotJA [Metabacillus niabensis]
MNSNKSTYTSIKEYKPFHGLYDPCSPIGLKYYSTPPNLYIGFQQPNMKQFSPTEALKKGTLWPAFWDYYENPYKAKKRDQA